VPKPSKVAAFLDEAETGVLADEPGTLSKEMPVAKQSKQESREELDRLVKQALEKGSVLVTKVDGRREETCGKCGAPNRVKIPVGQRRVTYTCKECGQEQKTM
jgi:hypothetical protein